jgi:hypothetical protein
MAPIGLVEGVSIVDGSPSVAVTILVRSRR